MPYCRPPRVRKPWTGSAVWRASLSKPQLWACWPPRSFTCRPPRSRSGSTLGCSTSGRSSIRRRRTPESSSPRPTQLRTLHASPLSPTTAVRSSSSARCGSHRPRRSSAWSVPSSSRSTVVARSRPSGRAAGTSGSKPSSTASSGATCRSRSRGRPLPSLAAYAASVVDRGNAHASAAQNSLLRMPRIDALPTLSAAAAPSELAGRIVVVGSLRPEHATPVGVAAAPQLVAQMLTSHLGGYYILERPQAALGAWAIALLLCLPFLFAASTRLATLVLLPLRQRSCRRPRRWLSMPSPCGCRSRGPRPGCSSRAPCSSCASRDEKRRAQSRDADALARARRAADDGRLKEAWALYRQLPSSAALFPEIYDLACALGAHGSPDEAADLFHRIAQVDGEFRDVAQRLVRARPCANARR